MGTRSREFRRNSRRHRNRGTVRASALCAQVRRALEWGFAELADERLGGLLLEDVIPHPNVSRMLVVLRCRDEQSIEDTAEIHAALRGATGLFRSWIAEAIHRKRTPYLVFVVLGHDLVAADVEKTP